MWCWHRNVSSYPVAQHHQVTNITLAIDRAHTHNTCCDKHLVVTHHVNSQRNELCHAKRPVGNIKHGHAKLCFVYKGLPGEYCSQQRLQGSESTQGERQRGPSCELPWMRPLQGHSSTLAAGLPPEGLGSRSLHHLDRPNMMSHGCQCVTQLLEHGNEVRFRQAHERLS